MITKQLPQPHFFIFSGLIFIKKYLPETVMIHREQQAEPHFGTPLPASSTLFLNSSPSPPLSKFYQTVISKSGVICALPRGWYTIKALLGPNQGHTKITGTSWRLTSCLPSFKLLYLCHCPSLSLSLSLSLFLFLFYLLAVVLPPSLGLISLSF